MPELGEFYARLSNMNRHEVLELLKHLISKLYNRGLIVPLDKYQVQIDSSAK
jgi:hypothetical protein